MTDPAHPQDEATRLATISSPGPLSRVVAALERGAASRAHIAELTGLDPEVVDTALDHLIRLGRVESEPLASGCPDAGCGGCPSGRADGSAGCGAAGPATSSGPIALTIRHLPGTPGSADEAHEQR